MHLYFVVPFNIFDYRHEQVHELLLETHTNCSSKRMLLHTNERTNEQTNETRAKLPALGPALKIENQPAEPRRPGLLNLGSWLLGPVCIEVQFCNADCNAARPMGPRTKIQESWASWFLVPAPVCIEVRFLSADLNASVRHLRDTFTLMNVDKGHEEKKKKIPDVVCAMETSTA